MKLCEHKLFLLDMDGTLYLENDLFDGALEFLEYVKKIGGKYMFLTNNSSKGIDKYIEKMSRLGIKTEESDFFTSTEATIWYLKKPENVEKYSGKKYPEGDFVDTSGNVIGKHKGIIRYTIGQGKKLGLILKEPLYVVSVDPENNRIILGKDEELYKTELLANDLNLISVEKIEGQMRVKAKIRYRQKEADATVTQISDDTIKVIFDEPQRAITKGQSVVLYDGDIVVGGGIIE